MHKTAKAHAFDRHAAMATCSYGNMCPTKISCGLTYRCILLHTIVPCIFHMHISHTYFNTYSLASLLSLTCFLFCFAQGLLARLVERTRTRRQGGRKKEESAEIRGKLRGRQLREIISQLIRNVNRQRPAQCLWLLGTAQGVAAKLVPLQTKTCLHRVMTETQMMMMVMLLDWHIFAHELELSFTLIIHDICSCCRKVSALFQSHLCP